MAAYIEIFQNAAREVWSELGSGYSERVYHNAMEVMLREQSIRYETERIIPIVFKGCAIGNLRADLVIDGVMVVELKATRGLREENSTQLQNYLDLTGLKVGILINFGTQGVEFSITQ